MDLYILFACVLLFFGAALIVRYFQKRSAFNRQLASIKKARLFTRKEAVFYSMLCHSCNSKAIVFGKRSVSDILKVKANLNLNGSHQKQYKAHKIVFDYVVCNRNDLSIIAVVSLIKAQEKKSKNIVKLKSVCAKAGFVLHCYPENYDDFHSVRSDLFD